MPQTKTKRGKPKNEALDHLRSMTRSLASTIGLDDDEDIARPISGFMSQYMGIDPDTGQLTETAMRNLKRIWNADARKKAGLPKEEQVWPGMLEDTVSLPAIFTDSVPDANAAAERAGAIHDTVRSDMGLRAPEGFAENALDAGGVMLGQLPIPSSKAKAAASGAMGWMKKIAGAPLEFFSPTVEPGIGNYLSGSLFGGGLGALADNPDSISPYLRALMTTELPGDPRVPSIHKAEGGKVGALRLFRGLVGNSKSGIPEEALQGKARKGYSTFMSNDPHVAGSYAMPRFDTEVGAIAPFHVKPQEIIEFPTQDGSFDKFAFDERASTLRPGQVLVARQVYDSGPRANLDVDPEKKFSYKSDVYAVGPGTDMKAGIGDDYGKGGKVGALSEFLRAVSLNPEATLKGKEHSLHDPLEDVLYAARKGVDSGKLSPAEHAELMKLLGVPDEDPGLYDRLMDLHTRLFPERPAEPTYQAFKPPRTTDTLPSDADLVPGGRGQASPDEWNRMIAETKARMGLGD